MHWWRRVVGLLLPHRRLETLPRIGRVTLRGEVQGPALERSPFTGQEAVAFRWAFAVARADADDRAREPTYQVLHERCSTTAFRLGFGAHAIAIDRPPALRWSAPETFELLGRIPEGDTALEDLLHAPGRTRPLLLSETALYAGDPVELAGWVERLAADGGGYRAPAHLGPAFRLRPDLGGCTLRDLSGVRPGRPPLPR